MGQNCAEHAAVCERNEKTGVKVDTIYELLVGDPEKDRMGVFERVRNLEKQGRWYVYFTIAMAVIHIKELVEWIKSFL